MILKSRTWVRDMSPYNARASDLGIGVADIARTWGAMETSFFMESIELVDISWEVMLLKYNCKIMSVVKHSNTG